MTYHVMLREVIENDLPILFEQQLDPEANFMAAFTNGEPADRNVFMAHWARIRGDESILSRTILYDGHVAGHVDSFMQFGEREVGYWIGKPFWGKGIATAALALFLEQVTERPLYARAVKDNIASLRVLQKCGFTITVEDKGFANARGEEVEEWILTLGPEDAE
ncbi:MAG: GNAT family N-acetyltransferase [Ktedonobacterales bacterium]